MGSFYSSCSISHMRLYNQKTSVQLLAPNNTDIQEYKSMIVGSGCQSLYSPFGFPINGVYDDYGHLSDIVEDRNTKMLEEFFNISIYDIINFIGRVVPDKIKNVDIYNSLSMTYFRTEVLEYLQDGWTDPSVEFNISKYLKQLDRDSITSELKGKYQNLSDEQIDLLVSICSKSNCGYLTSMSTLPINLSFKDDILKQFKFINKFNKLGRRLIPSDYGSQDVNFIETFKLNEFVNSLIVEDIKDYYDDDDSVEAKSIIVGYDRNNKLKSIGI